MNRWFAPLILLLATGAHAAPAGAPSVALHGHTFVVELATTDAQRQHGLMERTTLPADHGMLFVFASSSPQAFWMKNTLIPLDILYFDSERKLVSMQLDVPPCKSDPCPIYPSHAAAQYVLELSAGTTRRIGAKVGDELKIKGAVGVVQ